MWCCVAFLPGEILLGYVDELNEKRRTVFKNRYPSLDDYDSGYCYTPQRKDFYYDEYCDDIDSELD